MVTKQKSRFFASISETQILNVESGNVLAYCIQYIGVICPIYPNTINLNSAEWISIISEEKYLFLTISAQQLIKA